MPDTLTTEYPAAAKLKGFVALLRPWALGIRSERIEVETFDPEAILKTAPEDVIAFVFYRAFVIDIDYEGSSYRILDDTIVDEHYQRCFINIKKVYTRAEVSHWWKSDWYRNMRREMDRIGTDHAVAWSFKAPGRGNTMAYDPTRDLLLTR